jgi:hypothetical protein
MVYCAGQQRAGEVSLSGGDTMSAFSGLRAQDTLERVIYLKPDDDYRLIGPIPGEPLSRKKYDARTSVERAYWRERQYKPADLRVRY